MWRISEKIWHANRFGRAFGGSHYFFSSLFRLPIDAGLALDGRLFLHLSLRESTVVGLGIAARGGMGIILATIALEVKFITPSIFTPRY